MNKPTLPVTLITGFLGSGKTSFLNQLIKTHYNKEFLIIENEAGTTNLDAELITSKSGNRIFELTNGCICCSLNNELGTILNSLILSGEQYDGILIEATGIANPTEIIQLFSGIRMQKYFRLDSIICLVDALNFSTQYEKLKEIKQQIAPADYLVLNKTDLVDSSQLMKIKEQLKLWNPFSEILHATYGKTEHNNFIETHKFEANKQEQLFSKLALLPTQDSNAKNQHSIEVFNTTVYGDFNMKAIAEWLENYLKEYEGNTLRIKAILSIESMKHKIILQSVGNDYQVQEGTIWRNDEKRLSQLVFIGTSIPKEKIEKELSHIAQ